MLKRTWFWWTAALASVALFASCALLVDHLHPSASFCASDGGCAQLRASRVAQPFGVSLPAVGIAGMLAVGLTALLEGRRARIVHAGLSLLAGAIGLALVGVQLSQQTFCPYCLVVDGAALGLSGLAVARAKYSWDPPERRALLALALVGFLGALALPPLLVAGLLEGVPRPIAEELANTPKGVVTVVDFVDFECPHCRLLHEELAPLLAARRSHVRMVRKHVPLKMHAHAVDAAKACLCAEAQGLGDPMADALVRALPRELTPGGCELFAKQVGVDMDAYRACIRSRELDARLAKDRTDFVASGGHGLPLLWVNRTKLEGAQEREVLEKALDIQTRAQSTSP